MAVYKLCHSTWVRAPRVIETRPVVETIVYHDTPRVKITHHVPSTTICCCDSSGGDYLVYSRHCGSTNIYV